MKGFDERECASDCVSDSSKASFSSSWSTFLTSAYSILDPYRQSASHTRHNDWTSAVKRIVSGGSMRRFQERVLGSSKTGVSNSTSDIWLLGLCYNISAGDEAAGLTAFEQDFSSRIITTYRKGFDAIGDSGYTSDVNWGCMLRSSQMLFAQALIFHKFGRAWRKSLSKPLNEDYIEILHLFVDSAASPFSIHNLIQAGKSYGLAAGSWVGPYAVCRSWEALVRNKREAIDDGELHFPMALYVVSGDEDGERGGAPVLCIEDAKKHCTDFSQGSSEWTPILLLVPLVLGLEKVNPRYMSSLRATFSFPQSLGILGGKPGASTYMIGVQDDEVFYLDPHEVQTVVKISKDNLEADTSSYHCSTIRHIPLDSLDPSLAIGFYCRDKGDFDDFCSRASKLADESNGAPLFTVAKTHGISKPVSHSDDGDSVGIRDGPLCEDDSMIDGDAADGEEDEWQLL